MDIDIGARMIMEFPGKERMNCVFVGLLRDEFLLLKIPMTPGIRERVSEGAFLQFRYLGDGKIISFGAEVLRFQASPVALAFISYPKKFSEYNLRKQGRIECRFPTEIAVGEAVHSGHIIDMSAGGCRLLLEGSKPAELENKASVTGAFSTLEGERKYAFKGVIMTRQKSDRDQELGIKFDDCVDFPEGIKAQLEKMKDMDEIERVCKEPIAD